MENNRFIRKSTFIITIIALVIFFTFSIVLIILHYKDKNIVVNIPTVLEDDISSNALSNVIIFE